MRRLCLHRFALACLLLLPLAAAPAGRPADAAGRTELLIFEQPDPALLELTGTYPVRPAGTLFTAPEGTEFSLDIPLIPSYTVIHDRKTAHRDGSVSWFGYLKSRGPGFRVSLIKTNARLQGRILTPDGLFRIDTRGSRVFLTDMAACDMEASAAGPDDVKFSDPGPMIIHDQGVAAGPVKAADQSSHSTIDIMIIYNQSFSAKYPGEQLTARLNELMALANQAYSDSEVAISLRLVHSFEVLYTNETDNETVLDALTDGLGVFSQVQQLRQQYGADLVAMIRPYDRTYHGTCGIAWLNGYNGYDISYFADTGYAVISDGSDGRYYCDDYTFTHELGHTMGNAHDRDHANGQGAFPYAYGYDVSGLNAFGTIMSYDGPTLGYFSNPGISKCNGLPCGVAEGYSDSADNARSMNNTREKVAAFMNSTSTGDPDTEVTITSLSVSSLYGPQIDTPFQVTAAAFNPSGRTLYYKFFYRADYGTPLYDTSPWVVARDYDTSGTATFSFSTPGSYIIVARAVPDPANEPTALPITGLAVTVGDSNQVLIQNLYHTLTATPAAGDTVQYTANAFTAGNQTVYYKFFYRANYGTSDYDTTPWTVVQNYSTSATCSYTFPAAGDYIVVVRAVTDPASEPAALPIAGACVHVN